VYVESPAQTIDKSLLLSLAHPEL